MGHLKRPRKPTEYFFVAKQYKSDDKLLAKQLGELSRTLNVPFRSATTDEVKAKLNREALEIEQAERAADDYNNESDAIGHYFANPITARDLIAAKSGTSMAKPCADGKPLDLTAFPKLAKLLASLNVPQTPSEAWYRRCAFPHEGSWRDPESIDYDPMRIVVERFAYEAEIQRQRDYAAECERQRLEAEQERKAERERVRQAELLRSGKMYSNVELFNQVMAVKKQPELPHDDDEGMLLKYEGEI